MLNAHGSPARGSGDGLLRRVYALMWYFALPALPVRLWWRGRKEAGYRGFIGERFGRYGHRPAGPLLWVHAVSLGETNAARPLIARLRSRYPEAMILLTHMTATGRAAGAALCDERTIQAWLPYDVPAFVRAFLTHFRPAAGMLLETELWPNLIHEARRSDVPLFLVNARLSQRSAERYARISSLARPAFAALAGIAAQTDDDAQRIAALAGARAVVTGNLKFDVTIPPGARELGTSLRERFGSRAVWLFASSREGEEALVLDAWREAADMSDTLLVIVPRHPQRFDEVARLLQTHAIAYVRRSDAGSVTSDVAVVLGDTMGEMAAYCTAADVVLIGGSLLPFGGQNLIEPIALGRPTLVGPHMFNFAEATASAIACGAAIRVGDAADAIATARELLHDAPRRRQMEAAALAFHAAHRGAADRLWSWLEPQLDVAVARAEAVEAGAR